MVLSSLAVLLANATSISKVDNFEILILDNASVDADREFLNNNVSFARVVRSEVRVSFGEANNLLAEIATGDYLLFLNSDAFITSSGVERLMSELESDADAVAVAPTLFFPNGIVQEAGGAWLADGSVIQLGKGLASVPDVDISALRPYRSASCLMVRREAFERVGGFSYVFEPAYFEDTFLCAELSLVGRIQTIPSVKVVHLEGFTTNKIEHRSNKEISISLNRQKFVERVKNLDLISSPNALSQTKHNSSTRPKALLVSPYGLMIGGGEQYLLTLAAHLAVTHEVILAYPQVPSKFRFRRVLFDLGIGEFEASLVDFSEALWLRPDVLISMGNSLLPNFPPIGKHSVYHCQFPFPDGDSDSRLRLSWAEQYKALVVNSPFSADHTSAKLRQNPWIDRTHVIYPPVNAKDFSSVKEKPEPQVSAKFRIVSVGRFFEGQHCKNQLEMVRAFAELTREFTDIELTLFGGVAPDSASVNYLRKVTGLVGSKSISVRPDASRRSVLTEINRSHLYWHAAGLGVSEDEPWRMEHFGIAPIEACQLGVFPLVHDSGGVGRNLRTLSDGCVYRDFEELVSMTASLIERDDLPVGRDEIERFGNVFSVENFNENWDILLSSLLED
jgi:GT2 family glycosyltransferase/glycosyltransferase involved in cell wall biosynthesis